MSARYIKTPHLPEGKVGLCALGAKYRDLLEKPLVERGISALWLPDNPNVDPRLAGHADLMLLHLGGARVVTTCSQLSDLDMDITYTSRQGREYPQDIVLCACIVGIYCIHNFRFSDPAISGFERIDVRQGYAKCSVCVVDDKSIITSDTGIARAASSHGMDVLEIEPGHILLPGFDTGFIGGTTFKLSAHELAFTGELDGHPDRPAIEAFLEARGVEPVYLTTQPAFDIGSAVPLTETV